MEFPRRLDLQQVVRRILHLDEKVGDDVRDAEIAPIPGITLMTSSLLRTASFIQQLKLHALRRFPPGVLNGKRLFPNRPHARTIRQDHSGRRFELSLAADRASLPIKGNQNERTGSSPSQMKCRRLHDSHG